MNETIISSMNLCPKCKNSNPEGSKFCMHCGTALNLGATSKGLSIKQLDNQGNVIQTASLSDRFTMQKEGKNFTELDSKANPIEIVVENGKIFLKTNSSEKTFVKVQMNGKTELHIGQEFLVDGVLFKIESAT